MCIPYSFTKKGLYDTNHGQFRHYQTVKTVADGKNIVDYQASCRLSIQLQMEETVAYFPNSFKLSRKLETVITVTNVNSITNVTNATNFIIVTTDTTVTNVINLTNVTTVTTVTKVTSVNNVTTVTAFTTFITFTGFTSFIYITTVTTIITVTTILTVATIVGFLSPILLSIHVEKFSVFCIQVFFTDFDHFQISYLVQSFRGKLVQTWHAH